MLTKLHDKMGEELEKFGGFIECHKCKDTSRLNADMIAGYMRYGWPTCCGQTMTWVTARQEKEREEKENR